MTFNDRTADADKLRDEIKQHRPLKGQVLKQLREYFKVSLTWASNALEGNSLTETETKVVIEDSITIGGKPLKDHYEASATPRRSITCTNWSTALRSPSAIYSNCTSYSITASTKPTPVITANRTSSSPVPILCFRHPAN